MTNLYALIVGIEKYDLPNWNRSGPVASAIEMAYWCNSIGMPFKNLYMFLSINDQDAAWEKERKDQLAHFKKSGAKIVEDSKLDAIDTFWRNTLPTLPNVDSKLLVYWCGHGVTRPDRDRVFLHTDYNPRQLSGRVTSFNNFRATLATQAYHKFQEQLIVADVCGDFREQVSPNALPPANPVDSIAQHCYFASIDGQSAQIQNGIGQFTQSTLEVLSEYSAWPNLDELKNRMDETFRNGSLNPFKISIRTSREDYDDSDDDSAKASKQTKGSSNPKTTFKSHHDFFREQIYKLLDGNDELTEVFAQAIFSKNQKWDKNSIVDHFVVKSEKKNDFPLRRLKVVLDSLAAKRIELKQDSCQTLTILIEILTIASYPIEDSQTIEKAMQEILDTDTGNPTIGSLSTSKIEDAKKLLIATRIKLLGSEFSDLNIAKIFNKSITADNEVRLFLRKIHVVAAPAQKKDELTLLEFYSKAIIDDLNYEQNSKSYQDDLEDVLEQRSKVSAVISLLIPKENIEAIKQLRQRFPLLLVVELPKDSIGLYNAIFRDLKDIDECLPLLCGTVKRIT